jgi:protein ImuA
MPSPTPVDRTLPDLANVWRAGELGSASLQTVATGYAALDGVLPGGGWPQGALVELLQPQAGLFEWGLVAPALAALQAQAAGH